MQQLCFCAQIEIPTRRSCKVFYDVPVGSNINKVFTEICCFFVKEKTKIKSDMAEGSFALILSCAIPLFSSFSWLKLSC